MPFRVSHTRSGFDRICAFPAGLRTFQSFPPALAAKYADFPKLAIRGAGINSGNGDRLPSVPRLEFRMNFLDLLIRAHPRHSQECNSFF
jgi:hypothetical protein